MAGGINAYSYAYQNPVNYIDFNGEAAERKGRGIKSKTVGCNQYENLQCHAKCQKRGGLKKCSVRTVSKLNKIFIPDTDAYFERWDTKRFSPNCTCWGDEDDDDDGNDDNDGGDQYCPRPWWR